jgi:holo-[acyl-carrier protein] synthase
VIAGIGVDIVEVGRIQRLYAEHGQRFLQRLFCPAEVEYCLSMRAPAPHLAARFAAKEAVAKAFGTGIGARLGWQDIEVVRQESGQPAVVLHGPGQALLEAVGGARVHLSLTHTHDYAAAVAVLEQG